MRTRFIVTIVEKVGIIEGEGFTYKFVNEQSTFESDAIEDKDKIEIICKQIHQLSIT